MGVSVLALQITEWHYLHLSPQGTWQREEQERLRHRERLSEGEQTIFTLISIPLLPRNANNAEPTEREANRDTAAASLLTLSLLILC